VNIKEKRFWLFLLLILLALTGIFDHAAWTPDEPRVVAISLEMSKTGNLIVPHLAGIPFLEKPPGYFMLGALSIKLFSWLLGVTGAVRFISFLFAVGTLFFSYNLAKILYNRRTALFTALILGTSIGFIDNSHRATVDVGLAFFSIAAVWAFAMVFFRNKRWYCCYAALFTSGAFLCKGLIGVIFIAIAWAAMVGIAIYIGKKQDQGFKTLIVPHLSALTILISICGIWVWSLWHFGGHDLWYEWFMVNHVGRLTGTAIGKGHFRPEWYYYLETLVHYCLPWTPALLLSIYQFIKHLIKKQCIRQDIFIGIWILLSVVALSISETKRALYILPMLPAFAIMIAEFFNQHMLDSPKWYIVFDKILTTLFIVATIAAIIPFFAWELIEKQLDYPPFNPPQIVSWQFLAVSVTIGVMIFYLTRKKEKNIVINMSCLAAFAFIAILTILPYFAEGKKNMELTLKPFIERIDIEDRAQIAGWIFSETMLSGFYMYFDWSMPQLIKSDPETFAMTMDNERLKNIINGDDPTYKYVILERTKEEDIAKILGNNNYQILVDRNKIQRYKRNLILIEGTE
jgi:4-amino-4-deoxy-L-arabinose transferase-like glycosyltransferase